MRQALWKPLRERLKKDDLTRHSLLLVAFWLAAGLFNYLYQLSMGRMLKAEEFGSLFSLSSIFAIVMIFTIGFQTAITKFTSRLKVEGNHGSINALWRLALKRSLLLGFALFVASALISPWLASFLNLKDYRYPLILFSSFVFILALPVNWGILGGLQRFTPLGFTTALWSFLRFALGVLLVYLGLGVPGGLYPFFIATLLTFGVTLFFLRDLWGAKTEKLEEKGLVSYTSLAMLSILSFAAMTNGDVVLVKHYLSPEEAGNYSVLALLGRIVLDAPLGIAVAMFPKTSDLFERGAKSHALLWKALLLTLVVSGVGVALYALFPAFILKILFGAKYPLAVPYLFLYGLAMLLFALSYVLVNYSLSLNRTRVAYALLAAAVVEAGLIAFFHDNISQIVMAMLFSGALCLSLVFLTLRGRE